MRLTRKARALLRILGITVSPSYSACLYGLAVAYAERSRRNTVTVYQVNEAMRRYSASTHQGD